MKDMHNLESIPMLCIDVKNGIYVTPKYQHSPYIPIHVIKTTNPPKLECENQSCGHFMQIAITSGNPGKECLHLERTKNARPYLKPADLTLKSLKEMHKKGLVSKEWTEKCLELKDSADKARVDCIAPIRFTTEAEEHRWHFFSVFTNKQDSWCRFSRTRVTFDAEVGQWHCPCRESGASHRCLHRMMAMWWMFQECPKTLMAHTDIKDEDIEDLESHMTLKSTISEASTMKIPNIQIMTEYLWHKKRIPSLENIPLELRSFEKDPPPSFEPKEVHCPYCPGPTPPSLNASTIFTTQAIIYGIKYVKRGLHGALLFFIPKCKCVMYN